MEAYLEKQTKLMRDPDEEFAIVSSHRLLLVSIDANGNRKGIQTYLPRLREAINKVLTTKSASRAFRIQAKKTLLYGDGVELVDRLDHDASLGALIHMAILNLSMHSVKV